MTSSSLAEPRTVGIDCRSLEVARTGIGRYLENLLRGFATHCPHWSFLLYTLGPPPPDEALSRAPFTWRRVRFESPLQAHMFAAEWAREAPDVFFSPLYDLPAPISLPCVATVHDLVHEATPDAFSPVQLEYLRAAHRHTFSAAHHILTVSEFARRELIERAQVAPERVSVVHNAADARFSPCPDAASRQAEHAWLRSELGLEVPYLLYVGAISRKRHLAETVRGFLASDELRATSCRLVMAGPDHLRDPDELPSLLAEAERAAPGRVRYHPYVSNEALVRLLRHAQGLVYLSTYEGFGLPPLEAAACRVPSVLARASALPEVLGDAACWVDDPTDLGEVTRALEVVGSPGPLRDRLASAALRRSQDFSWERSAHAVLECLARVAQGG